MVQDAGLFVTPARIGPWDQIEIHCFGCGRTVRWEEHSLPHGLPRDLPFKKMEPRLRCTRCRKRGEAKVAFWRPER